MTQVQNSQEEEIQVYPKLSRRERYAKQFTYKKIFTYFAMVLPLSVFFAAGIWNFSGSDMQRSATLLSPIPDFLRISENSQVKILDLWSPVVQQSHGSAGSSEVTELTAQGILMYDLTTDKVLYERDAKVRRPMASVTKIMTAIVAIEHQRSDNRYIVSPEDIVGENSMGVTPGEAFTMEELLYGLMLPSGNDAAEVLANNYPQGREAFVQAMNDKAKAIGAVDTRFSNPSGLQGDGEQYTTPYDLVVITRYAMDKHEIFRDVVATATHEIPQTNEHGAYSLVNETNLLTTYQGVKGVKTGFTPEAGLCLVTFLDYGGHQIIGVVLNSQNRRGEMKQLLDYSLKSVGIEPPPFEEPI
jgi:serine-type D-Ala-D-Ala carboxypeptidase (penicillin-binding protein 5/6)